MKSPFFIFCRVFVAMGVVLSFTSCEDKALIQKNKELRQELSGLERKVDLLKLSAGEDPGDQTEAIKVANTELSDALEQIKTLDGEKERIEAAHEKMEKDLREYKKKYQIQ